MGTILEFPSQQAQGLAYLEREMRQLLNTKGADEQLIEFATEQLTLIYSRVAESESYRFSVQLPDGLSPDQSAALEEEIHKSLEGLRKENHRQTLELVAQLLLAEVMLFQQTRADEQG
jgi:hypothetical protein